MLEVFIILMLVSMISVVLKKVTVVFLAILYAVFFKKEELIESEGILDVTFIIMECLLAGLLASFLVSGFIFFIIIAVAFTSMVVTSGLGLLEKIVDIVKD
tara:strand:- start:6696 stop:6998 length:303 start_codon:yes stop_codon:yes gene_type:complete